MCKTNAVLHWQEKEKKKKKTVVRQSRFSRGATKDIAQGCKLIVTLPKLRSGSSGGSSHVTEVREGGERAKLWLLSMILIHYFVLQKEPSCYQQLGTAPYSPPLPLAIFMCTTQRRAKTTLWLWITASQGEVPKFSTWFCSCLFTAPAYTSAHWGQA